MKNILSTLFILLLFFTFTNIVNANTIYGPSFAKFSIDIPANWKCESIPDGVYLTSPNDDTYLSISVFKFKNFSLEKYVHFLAKDSGLNTINKDKSGNYVINGFANQNFISYVVGKDGDKLIKITLYGKNLDTIHKILDSIKSK